MGAEKRHFHVVCFLEAALLAATLDILSIFIYDAIRK